MSPSPWPVNCGISEAFSGWSVDSMRLLAVWRTIKPGDAEVRISQLHNPDAMIMSFDVVR